MGCEGIIVAIECLSTGACMRLVITMVRVVGIESIRPIKSEILFNLGMVNSSWVKAL